MRKSYICAADMKTLPTFISNVLTHSHLKIVTFAKLCSKLRGIAGLQYTSRRDSQGIDCKPRIVDYCSQRIVVKCTDLERKIKTRFSG